MLQDAVKPMDQPNEKLTDTITPAYCVTNK